MPNRERTDTLSQTVFLLVKASLPEKLFLHLRLRLPYFAISYKELTNLFNIHILFFFPLLKYIFKLEYTGTIFPNLSRAHLKTVFYSFLILGAKPDVGNRDNRPRRPCTEQTRGGKLRGAVGAGNGGEKQRQWRASFCSQHLPRDSLSQSQSQRLPLQLVNHFMFGVLVCSLSTPSV